MQVADGRCPFMESSVKSPSLTVMIMLATIWLSTLRPSTWCATPTLVIPDGHVKRVQARAMTNVLRGQDKSSKAPKWPQNAPPEGE